jgi:hypothetical protein
VPDERQQTIQGLRDLADFLEAHPDLKISDGDGGVQIYLGHGADEVEALTSFFDGVGVSGVEGHVPRHIRPGYTDVHVRRRFGLVSLRAVASPAAVDRLVSGPVRQAVTA